MTLPHLCYDRRAYLPLKTKEKAGEGNRTPVCSLGSCRSAIELHPRSEIFDFRFSKPTIIGSPNQFKVYSFRGCRLQPKQIVSANRLFTLDATIIATKLRRRSLYRCYCRCTLLFWSPVLHRDRATRRSRRLSVAVAQHRYCSHRDSW